jgi:hypothetical protein
MTKQQILENSPTEKVAEGLVKAAQEYYSKLKIDGDSPGDVQRFLTTLEGLVDDPQVATLRKELIRRLKKAALEGKEW